MTMSMMDFNLPLTEADARYKQVWKDKYHLWWLVQPHKEVLSKYESLSEEDYEICERMWKFVVLPQLSKMLTPKHIRAELSKWRQEAVAEIDLIYAENDKERQVGIGYKDRHARFEAKSLSRRELISKLDALLSDAVYPPLESILSPNDGVYIKRYGVGRFIRTNYDRLCSGKTASMAIVPPAELS